MEHVASDRNTWLRTIQEWVDPVWFVFADGCNLCRETWVNIEACGFSDVQQERFFAAQLMKSLGLIRPHLSGICVK